MTTITPSMKEGILCNRKGDYEDMADFLQKLQEEVADEEDYKDSVKVRLIILHKGKWKKMNSPDEVRKWEGNLDRLSAIVYCSNCAGIEWYNGLDQFDEGHACESHQEMKGYKSNASEEEAFRLWTARWHAAWEEEDNEAMDS